MLSDQKKKIYKAIKEQDLSKLQELIKDSKEDDLNFTDLNGNTILHYAVNCKSINTLPIVQVILENGGDPEQVNKNFKTPLDLARSHVNIAVITMMKHYINLQKEKENEYLKE